jgi:hypothetical protein
MESTERLSLPMLIPGQSQKEVFHNEALQLLDIVVAAAVEEPPSDDPPALPTPGTCYLVGPSPNGPWSQHADHIAAFSNAGWRFVAPTPGLAAFVKSAGTFAVYRQATWDVGTLSGSRVVVDGAQVIGPRGGAIASPNGGTTVDAEARATLDQILTTLRTHGLIASS